MNNFPGKGTYRNRIQFCDYCPGNGIDTNTVLEQNIHFQQGRKDCIFPVVQRHKKEKSIRIYFNCMAPHCLLSLFYCFFFAPFSSMSVCLSLSIFFYSLTPLSQQSIKWRYFFFILYMLATRFVPLVPNLKNEWCMVCVSLESEPFDSHILNTL